MHNSYCPILHPILDVNFSSLLANSKLYIKTLHYVYKSILKENQKVVQVSI